MWRDELTRAEKEEILAVLDEVYDPDYRDKSIVEMGLIGEDDIRGGEGGVVVSYTLTAPLCPFSAAIGVMIKYALEKKFDFPVEVELKQHPQKTSVNDLLESEEKTERLVKKLEESGVLEECVRV